MLSHLRRSLLALLCGLSLISASGVSLVAAQSTGEVRLAIVETVNFPRLSTYLEVRDGEGNFLYDLQPADVHVIENEVELPIAELNLIRPGVQMVVAINPGPSFAIRDAQGQSRYDYLSLGLRLWAESRQEGAMDDFSLVVSEGPETTHKESIEDWMDALQAYQPEARSAVPNFDVLARALEIAADPTPRQGMGRGVLLVTAIPDQDVSVGLQSLAARASQRGVRVFVWLVASAEQFNSPAAAPLAELAAGTGGALFAYSGIEEIPNPESYLEPLRSAYYLAYDSAIAASGTHQLAVKIQGDGLQATSQPREFELEVLPPNVAFVSPNLEIKRIFPAEGSEDPTQAVPRLQALEVLIEFPDGHPRPLERTKFYVDGSVVGENTAPPFEKFSWDLSAYSSTGRHSLKVEALDSLGLSAASMEISVLVSLDRPTQGLMTTVSRNRSLVAGLVVLLAGAVLLLVLVLGGQIGPGFVRRRKARVRRSDPVTQPVRMKNDPTPQRSPGIMNRLHWPQRRLSPKPYAFMVRLLDIEGGEETPPLSIGAEELTFGRDPLLSTQVLEDPSVDALHSRLRRELDGSYRLLDEGSIAGTWINFTPVSQEGAQLEHGDLIHVGRVGFRFSLSNPERVRRPVIKPEEPTV
ncbi:MAG TPA: FHA domain-containing protein [Anaerolineales bacterium]|nr:FHA domain-containing protein [Anaerolineales bacterium]